MFALSRLNRTPARAAGGGRGTVAIVGILLGFTAPAGAYPVGPAVSLNKLTEMADLIVKARAIATEKTDDAWFTPHPGFAASATKLEPLTFLKGEPAAGVITFRHYASEPEGPSFFMPQHYEFTPGRCYLVFAAKTGKPGVFRQLWANHTDKEDQGVLRIADNRLPVGESVRAACWSGLTGLLASGTTDDVVYAIRQLDQMSGTGWSALKDFPRPEVAEAIRPLLASTNREVVLAAIAAASSRNPHTGNEALHWLVTVGKGHLPGIAARDARFDNLSGRLLWRELAAVADGNAPAEVRSAAIRALGRSGVEELHPRLERWCGDPEALVRQAAMVLLSDSREQDALRLIREAAGDPAAEVRQGAAQAIGFAQETTLVPLLGRLLADTAPKVRQAAAMSLLSFDVAVAAEVMREHLRDPEYHSLFVNALAARDPAPYTAELQQIVVGNEQPRQFWGGRIPAADSWDILFRHVQSQPAADLQAGKFDAALQALGNLKWHSSSEPRDLYALYLQRGLTNRAQAFRQQCRRTLSYDIDYYFNQVDRSPNAYTRQ
jgi:hypothetical protein